MTFTSAAVTRSTPDGPFTIIAGALGVLASGWTDDIEYLLPLIHEALRPAADEVFLLSEGSKRDSTHESARPALAAATDAGTDAGAGSDPAERHAREAADAVDAYYAGNLEAPSLVPTVQKSGQYREHAWDVLREIAPGQVLTYTEYAARTGNPLASRAAASACASNAAALFVPCHRVMRADGSLGGFRYGVAMKERLLARETAVSTVPVARPGTYVVPVALF